MKTSSDGSFAAVWTPDVTGNYLIKAAVDATSTFNAASKTVNLALTPDAQSNIFTVNSNSTISEFAFNSTSAELSFVVSGPAHTTGYVEIYIPKTLLSDVSALKAYIDGTQVSFNSESQADSWLITFTYSHSEHRVTMEIGSATQPSGGSALSIPEWVYYVVPIVVGAVIAAAILIAKRSAKTPAKVSVPKNDAANCQT